MHFHVYEFEVGVNDSIFSGNEQQKVHCFMIAIFSRFYDTSFKSFDLTSYLYLTFM